MPCHASHVPSNRRQLPSNRRRLPPTAVGYPPPAVGSPPAPVGYPPTAVGYPPTAVSYPPTAVGYLQPPSVTPHPPLAPLQLPSVTLQPPSVTLQPPSVTLQPPSVPLQLPSVTLQPPSVTSQVCLRVRSPTFLFFWSGLGSALLPPHPFALRHEARVRDPRAAAGHHAADQTGPRELWHELGPGPQVPGQRLLPPLGPPEGHRGVRDAADGCASDPRAPRARAPVRAVLEWPYTIGGEGVPPRDPAGQGSSRTAYNRRRRGGVPPAGPLPLDPDFIGGKNEVY